ncbi:MAG TPA: MFS transporter [Candidatus Dormibacteraeota bacterium]|nr:MFS transporter [Candidatus Dormibacteraeota bacterium]
MIRSHRAGLWLVAYSFFVVMLGTTLTSPLYPIYQQRFGFSPLLITVIFAVYGVSVIAGLLLFGRMSDVIGRRWMLFPGVVLSGLSAIAIATAAGLLPILVARVLSGLSAAIFTGSATAAMLDLSPQDQRVRATTLAVAANLGGLGAGQLLSGVLAQYAPHPLQLVFLVDLVLAVIASVAIVLTPETVQNRERRWRFQRLTVPDSVRPNFVPAAISGFAGFAVFGGYGSTVPGFVARQLHLPNHALLGLLLFLLLGLSVVGQLMVTRLRARVALPLGAAALILGAALLGLAVVLTAFWPLALSVIVLGIAQGLVIGSGLAGINQRAPREQRGEVASTYFIVLYVGLSVPVVAVGLATQALGPRPAELLLAGSAILVVGAVLLWLLLRPVPRD